MLSSSSSKGFKQLQSPQHDSTGGAGRVASLQMPSRRPHCGACCPAGAGVASAPPGLKWLGVAILGSALLALLFFFLVSSTKTYIPPTPAPPLPPVLPSFTFVTLGDWGSSTPDQFEVARVLGLTALRLNVSLLLTTGDNFYETGVANDTDPKWNTLYRSVYTHPSLMKIPWLAALGNHDHYAADGGQAQIDYYKNNRDSRWVMENWYYTRTIKAGNTSVMFVVFDTTIATNVNVNDTAGQALRRTQQDWLLRTLLQQATADWIVVSGHHPFYSFHYNTPLLLTEVLPLFNDARVDLYLGGHDHDLQHLAGNDMQFVISGAGSKKETSPINRPAQGLWSAQQAGFTVHQVYDQTMTTRFINRDGVEIHSFVQQRRVKPAH